MGTKRSRRYRQHSAAEKVAILRQVLLEGQAVSKVCEEHDVSPTLFYAWQKQFFENGAAAFAKEARAEQRDLERQVDALRQRLTQKDRVIAKVTEEFVKTKKQMGEPSEAKGIRPSWRGAALVVLLLVWATIPLGRRLGLWVGSSAPRLGEEALGGLVVAMLVGIAGAVIGSISLRRDVTFAKTVYAAVLTALFSAAIATSLTLVWHLGSEGLVHSIPGLLAALGVVLGWTAGGGRSRPATALLGAFVGGVFSAFSPLTRGDPLFALWPLVIGIVVATLVYTIRVVARRGAG